MITSTPDWQKFLLPYQQQLTDMLNLMAQFPEADICECEKECVYTQGIMSLYRYRKVNRATAGIPVLIVFALVNRPYIIDLQPDRSLVRPLLEAGLDVYIIDWGYPTDEDAHLTLEDYIVNFLDQCVDFIRAAHKQTAIDLLGVCQGGTFSLCYTALFPEKIRKLIPMSTAVDFHTQGNTLAALAEDLNAIAMIEQYKNMPGWLLNLIFFTLKPAAQHMLKYLRIIKEPADSAKLALFIRLEHWLYDTPDQAGAAFIQYICDLYQQNKLIKGEFYLNNIQVNLKQITHPVLNIFASQDDIIPPSASSCLPHYIGSHHYQELILNSGHIGLYTSHKAQAQIAPAIIAWLLK